VPHTSSTSMNPSRVKATLPTSQKQEGGHHESSLLDGHGKNEC
jgi:hypothetical protein